MNTSRTSVSMAIAYFFVAAVALSGCGKKDAASASDSAAKSAAKGGSTADKSIIGVTLSPDVDRPLKAGSTVTVSVQVDYLLPSQGGQVGVVVQDAGDKPAASVLKEVPGGVGKFTTDVDFKVAQASKTVRISVPLYIKGESQSTEIITKEYAVER